MRSARVALLELEASVQRSALCRSRRELSNAYLLAKWTQTGDLLLNGNEEDRKLGRRREFAGTVEVFWNHRQRKKTSSLLS